MPVHRSFGLAFLLAVALSTGVAVGEQPAAEEKKPADAGHSYHGQAFNEGPRQQAYLMTGTGPVRFPVSTKDPLCQSFIHQGLGQLYGFWYWEAERSFRQAASIDRNCAMAYWGMAQANVNNEERAKGFMLRAMKLKPDITRREQLYIDALNAYFEAGSGKNNERAQAYAKALEQIAIEFPEDIEAKAMLGLQLWINREKGVQVPSFLAYDALLKQVLAVEPMHPCHHFRIHLWDYVNAAQALDSAARCGQSAPAIAHMWHMSGHIYSGLQRYQDAAWQQEASARVDHAYMMRDRILPDQIHNFAHNNEWLIRDLTHIGRVRDAVALSRNLAEMPRHPKFNTLSNGSAHFGRARLFDVLSDFELWDELIAACQSSLLEPTADTGEQIKRLRHLGRAYFRTGDVEQGKAQLGELDNRHKQQTAERDKATAEAESKAKAENKEQKQIDEAKKEAERRFRGDLKALENSLEELRGHLALAEGKSVEAVELFKKAGGVDESLLAVTHLVMGNAAEAEKVARKAVEHHKNEVRPLANLVQILWMAGKKEEAKKTFEQLRELSSVIDLSAPPFARLTPAAQEFGYLADWRVVKPASTDVGNRPDLNSLGPLVWSPVEAPPFAHPDVAGKERNLAEFRGRNVLLVFYLGVHCPHCMEQLNAISAKASLFAEQNIALVGISTDDQAGLQKTVDMYTAGPLPVTILSGRGLESFKAYRAHDDFESQPLHATFLIDAAGRVRWQDISYQPFMDVDFLLQESRRLLSLPGQSANAPTQAAAFPTARAQTQ
jgi:peroxiredoxin/tetratricopeptide (TPR) repeat protein